MKWNAFLASLLALSLVSCGGTSGSSSAEDSIPASDVDDPAIEESEPIPEEQADDTPYQLDVDALTDANIGPIDTDGLTLYYGDLLGVTYGGDGVVVVKAKISGQMSNKLTIQQNFYTVSHLITDNGFLSCSELQYWAVMDTTSGEETKVISFSVSKDLMNAIFEERVLPNQMGDYVQDLWIIPALQG